jgi:hypothetical protein
VVPALRPHYAHPTLGQRYHRRRRSSNSVIVVGVLIESGQVTFYRALHPQVAAEAAAAAALQNEPPPTAKSTGARATGFNGFLFPMVCLGHTSQQVRIRRRNFRLCEDGQLPVVLRPPPQAPANDAASTSSVIVKENDICSLQISKAERKGKRREQREKRKAGAGAGAAAGALLSSSSEEEEAITDMITGDLERQWENVQEAFETYLQEHGDLAVKISFVVPSCSPWPEKLWGMALGKTVNSIRSNGTFVDGKPERRQWLEARGFLFTPALVSEEEVITDMITGGGSTIVPPVAEMAEVALADPNSVFNRLTDDDSNSD